MAGRPKSFMRLSPLRQTPEPATMSTLVPELLERPYDERQRQLHLGRDRFGIAAGQSTPRRTKFFRMLAQIIEQTPPAFRTARAGPRTFRGPRRQQSAINFRDPLIDRLPAFFHSPGRK